MCVTARPRHTHIDHRPTCASMQPRACAQNACSSAATIRMANRCPVGELNSREGRMQVCELFRTFVTHAHTHTCRQTRRNVTTIARTLVAVIITIALSNRHTNNNVTPCHRIWYERTHFKGQHRVGGGAHDRLATHAHALACMLKTPQTIALFSIIFERFTYRE